MHKWEQTVEMNVQQGVGWICVGQEGDQRQALANRVVSQWFGQKREFHLKDKVFERYANVLQVGFPLYRGPFGEPGGDWFAGAF